jgi:hypothetical protein
MKKITCSSCGGEIDSLKELLTCSSGLFKVAAYHEVCYEKKNKKNNLIIYKPDGARTLHLAALLFTVFAALVMIVFRKVNTVTVLSLAGIIILDIYICLSVLKIERHINKQ